MSFSVLRMAAVLYAAGAAAYVVTFVRPTWDRGSSMGFALVTVGFLVHGASIGLGCSEFGGAEFFNLRGGFGMLGWIAAGAFLVLQYVKRLPSVGAFVVPLIVIAVLPGVFGLGPRFRGVVPNAVRLPALQVHVTTAAAGMALFVLASGVALMYLLQERQLKRKRFGPLFARLPPLDTLDRINRGLVQIGFLFFSVALVTGALVAKNVWGSFWTWDPQQITSLAVWLLYGAMVQLHRSGVHGRRYAILTLVGLVFLIGSVVGMATVLQVTRHGGSFR